MEVGDAPLVATAPFLLTGMWVLREAPWARRGKAVLRTRTARHQEPGPC